MVSLSIAHVVPNHFVSSRMRRGDPFADVGTFTVWRRGRRDGVFDVRLFGVCEPSRFR